MKTDNGITTSLWMTTAPPLPRPALEENTEADVCIVGAGIAGLSVAYLLSQEGKKVIVLDDGPIGGGETCRTTAHLVTALDDRYFDLEKMHGREGSRLAAQSHSAAIDRVEKIVRDERIDCGFERLDGFLFLTPGEPLELLKTELEAIHRAGLSDVELLDRVPHLALETGPCLRFPRQGQFHILHYLAGLVTAIEKAGGEIFTHSHVATVQGGKNAHVETDTKKRVSAASIAVATNAPVNDRVVIHTKQAAYRSYVIAARIPKSAFPRILLWDTGGYSKGRHPVPYHYLRVESLPEDDPAHATEELLVFGGEDHKTGQADDADKRYERLEAWGRKHFPEMTSIEYRWSGQVLEPVDGLAYIGRNPLDTENVFVATGDSGNGMTHGTIAGMLITDLIMGRNNPWEEIYKPSRKPTTAIRGYVHHNLNVTAQYADLVTPGDVQSSEEIEPGSGAVIRKGIRKIALYRDPKGTLHACSAICPHLGGVVQWNDSEKTWDCPCHGSRFATDGHVINGPAAAGLPATKA